MEGGKWEDLSTDLLADIFRRVGMEELLLDVPLVCKSWYKASLEPICWQHLKFPKYIRPCCAWDYIVTPYPGRIIREYGHRHYIHGLTELGCPFPISAFIKFVVNRSCRCATELTISICCYEKAIVHVANECRGLKALHINVGEHCSRFGLGPAEKIINIPRLLSNCKNLEVLDFGRGMHVVKMVASAIVTLLPNLKRLVLEGAIFYKKKYLVMIIQACKQIVHMDVRNCIGFYYHDAEILKHASHIPVFLCQGYIQG